jgi:hypothetical protein
MAKMDWIKHGDRNTKFFHVCANSKSRKNRIKRIKDEKGKWWDNDVAVGQAFVDYFSLLFSANEEVDMGPCLQSLEAHVIESMNAELVGEFHEEEISQALFQMAPLKAPRPDGMNACFFQKNWD